MVTDDEDSGLVQILATLICALVVLVLYARAKQPATSSAQAQEKKGKPATSSALAVTAAVPRDRVCGAFGKGREKWDEAIATLRSKKRSISVYSATMFILQHDHWYTKDDACAYPPAHLRISTLHNFPKTRNSAPPTNGGPAKK